MSVLWRDTGIPPKIGPLDARAIFPLTLWLFHWSYFTAFLALTGIVILFLVQRTGMTPMACLHAIKIIFIGKRREASFDETLWRKRCRW